MVRTLRKFIRFGSPILLISLVRFPTARGQEASVSQMTQTSATPASEERIVTPEEVRQATQPPGLTLIRAISFPGRVVTHGMERGLINVEKHRLLERLRMWKDRPRGRGVAAYFGGLGEQTGFGGGASYTVRPFDWQRMTFLARGTLAHYQEFDIRWAATAPKTEVSLEASHQWRPKENFYGLGHDSLESQHTDFALSQSWVGARLELSAPEHFRWGADYRLVGTRAVAGRNGLTADTTDVFPDLPALGTRVRLQTTGADIDVDFSQGEYGWTGRAHASASYQQGFRPSHLRYFNYEWRVEGRMPVIHDRSALVGQFTMSLNHENSGSDPIPFYMRPRIGGSSTMRGFALDRFYGKNLILMSLDYRYSIHPNFQAYIFHDAGQIYDRSGELSWFNWHRNYGIGIRLHSQYRTILRLEYGHSSEGFDIHLIFGDRAPQALSGPVRHGTYRR
jgi:Omp85 superfamily domain